MNRELICFTEKADIEGISAMSEWLGSGGASTGRQQRTFGRQRSSSALYDGTSGSRGKGTGPSFDIAVDEEDNPFSETNTSRSRSQSTSSVSNLTAGRGLRKHDDNTGSGTLSAVGEFGNPSVNATKIIAKRKNTSKEDSQDTKKKKEARAASPRRQRDQQSMHSSTSSAFGITNT